MGESSRNLLDLPVVGLAGGILVVQDTGRLEIVDSLFGDDSLSIRCKCIATNELWTLTAVYGPMAQAFKDNFWAELDTVGRYWSGPWLLTGDFNGVKQNSKRSNGRASRYEKVMFREFIDTCGLLEFGRDGSNYTYSNGQCNHTISRTDRFIANPLWFELFQDHKEVAKAFYGVKPFHFEFLWLRDKDLLEKMQNWWMEDSTTGKQGFVLFKKIKNLKANVRMQESEKFGKCEKCIKRWEDEVMKFELSEEDGLLTNDQRQLKHVAKVNLEEALKDRDRF